MSKIKFRQPLWGKHREFVRFHYWGFIDGVFVEPEFEPYSSYKEALEQSQQYIGLKDKNGKEIYEGDWGIMPFFWRYKEDGIDIEEEGYYEGQIVIIASGGACIRNPIRHKYNLTKDTPKEICQLKQYRRISAYITEVIGNIRENPKLQTGEE